MPIVKTQRAEANGFGLFSTPGFFQGTTNGMAKEKYL